MNQSKLLPKKEKKSTKYKDNCQEGKKRDNMAVRYRGSCYNKMAKESPSLSVINPNISGVNSPTKRHKPVEWIK